MRIQDKVASSQAVFDQSLRLRDRQATQVKWADKHQSGIAHLSNTKHLAEFRHIEDRHLEEVARADAKAHGISGLRCRFGGLAAVFLRSTSAYDYKADHNQALAKAERTILN
jgi:hypothetical protein